MSLGFHRFFCLAPPPPQHNSRFAGSELVVFHKYPAKPGFGSPRTKLELHLRAASITGSDAGYSEQLPDSEKKRTTQKIAGIDQDELLDPMVLADRDSFFCEFKGVHIHHKICEENDQTEHSLHSHADSQLTYQTKKIGMPIILLHGFGASVFSWERAMKPLAQVTGGKVLAFDRPAFGLTSRVNYSGASDDSKPLNPYSLAFSVLATLSFIDILAAEKAILIGHSAGSLVAVDTYFEAPERVAALILVAPAILAPYVLPKGVKGNQMRRENQNQDNRSSSNIIENSFIRIGRTLSKFFVYIAQGIMQMLKGMVDMISSVYKKALKAVLCSAFGVMLVRIIIDKFGIAAIRNSWYDATQISSHTLCGYTKPLRVKDWDRALVEYTIAMLTDVESESKPPLTKRLHEISCPGATCTSCAAISGLWSGPWPWTQIFGFSQT
ncbi:PREDICTED: uncharacterized protein LOC104612964 isoform X2 [Nelumbo nucifera]|uniref:Uncharacterized protein LOC104612964 isoform X2 n=1 Tax=Nelumbo nucifera TaxID=4432 RepID=A0A1U8BC13_NELNU|nr:PREDICTED: uncharacterized protein LOC104612964 isoform X2 [Nelumbo nucifera]